MSRVSGVGCDVCEKVVVGTDTTPDGWFVVFRSRGESNVANLQDEPSEVCSPKCLCALGSQLKQLERAKPPAGGKKKTLTATAECEICHKPFKNLGVHMHRAHGK